MRTHAACLFCLVAVTALLMAWSSARAEQTDTPTLADQLTYLRQEEKLAHDVYLALGEKWKLRMFQNIAAAETRHTQAVAALMKAHDIPDPVAEMEPGDFADKALQKLHDQLVESGSKSLADALKVGAQIEEMDIADLDRLIADTDDENVKTIYERLRCGSANHLRAFNRQLTHRGIEYTPQHLTAEAYQKVLDGKQGPCGPGHGNGKGQCGQQGQGQCNGQCKGHGRAANSGNDD